MNRRSFYAMFVAALIATPVLAHGPTPQQLSRSAQVNASADAVWAILADPASITTWQPDIVNTTIKGEGPGAKRVVEFASGGTVINGIDDINDEKMMIRRRLSKEDIEVFPVSYYTNSITVTPEGDGANIAWQASFFRAETLNEPEERFSDAAAVSAMEKYADDALAGIKAAAEAGS